MDRYEDIIELLDVVKSDITLISAEYERAKSDEDVAMILRPKIKTCIESLRSVLDYAAIDIRLSYTKKKNKVYFPYGATEEEFIKNVSVGMHGFKEHSPAAYSLVESLQPYRYGSDWLVVLCKRANFNKHNRLSSQKRVNSPAATTTLGGLVKNHGSSTATFLNCYVDGLPLAKNGTLIMSPRHRVAEIEKQLFVPLAVSREYEWVEFEIDGSSHDALKLITVSHTEISNFISELKKILTVVP